MQVKATHQKVVQVEREVLPPSFSVAAGEPWPFILLREEAASLASSALKLLKTVLCC